MILTSIIINLFIDKNKIMKKNIKKIKNAKYVISVTLLIILFIAYGLLRNFR